MNKLTYEELRKIIIDKDHMLYEEDIDGSEWYKCFWCDKRTPENTIVQNHDDTCLYKKLLDESLKELF